MGKLYFAKFLCTFLLLTVTLVLELAALLTFAAWRGFPGPIPVGLVGKVFLGTMLVSVFVLALQQWIAMAVPNQLVALIVGMAGSFLGLVGALFPAQVRAFLPWCGYAELSSVQAVPLGDHEWQYLADGPQHRPSALCVCPGDHRIFPGKAPPLPERVLGGICHVETCSCGGGPQAERVVYLARVSVFACVQRLCWVRQLFDEPGDFDKRMAKPCGPRSACFMGTCSWQYCSPSMPPMRGGWSI